MIELESRHYGQALALLDQVQMNTLFARAVLEQHIAGKVYADSADSPRAFYVAHSYGMSLVFGDDGIEEFNNALRDYLTDKSGTRQSAEWLQADPEGGWTGIIDSFVHAHNGTLESGADLHGGIVPRAIQRNTRVNFAFDRQAHLEAKEQFLSGNEQAVPITKEYFDALQGGVVPRYFWRDASHFAAEGAGYALLADGEIAAAAFSSCRTAQELEIGIETSEGHRGKGYAFAVSSALIDYCLEHGLEPVWACRLENEGSYRLAQKLGFRPSLTLPYYRLAYQA